VILGVYFYRCGESVPIMMDILHGLKARKKGF
jgi:hypothetical protein